MDAFGRDERGITDIVGNVLLIAITVAATGSLAFLISSLPEPEQRHHAELQLSLSKGAGDWGSGDEAVVVEHVGGDRLDRRDVHVVLVRGATTTHFEDAALDGAFADGFLTVGERWEATMTVSSNEAVDALVLYRGKHLLATGTLQASLSCGGDVTPPSVASLTVTPADLTTAATGSVAVEIVLADDCSGVDEASPVRLEYRLDDGTNPGWSHVAMSDGGIARWTGTIPDLGWATAGGETLDLNVTRFRDGQGNEGSHGVRSDPVDVTGANHYVTAKTDVVGTTNNFSRAQSAADAGAEAELKEATTGGPASITLSANAVASAGGWSTAGSGFASDDAYATTTSFGKTAEYRLADQGGNPGTITSVVVRAEVSIVGYVNDGFTLRACTSAGTCSAASAVLSGSGSDVTIQHDVTSLVPGGGSWTWTKVNDLQLRVKSEMTGGSDGTWRIDHAWVAVGYSVPLTHATDVRMDVGGVPAGTHYLNLRYRTNGADTYALQVWDGGTWTTRATLDQATAANVTYRLTAAEYNGGTPQVRFLDANAGGSPGRLHLDWVRVVVT